MVLADPLEKKRETSSEKITTTKRAGSYLPCKCEALSSNPSTAPTSRKKEYV
jgi:hypothetical protein